MNKTLLIGDLHIEDSAIEELQSIFENDIFKIKVDSIIQLGDLFDKNRPTPKELKFATELIHKLTTLYKNVTLLAGNGSHEFKDGIGIIEYLKELSEKIKIITKDHFTENNIYYGHHMLNESKLEYGTGKIGLKDLKKYKFAFLGHQHNPQDFNKNVFHVGSLRYVHFNEVEDEFKRVALLEDDKVKFIELKSSIPMVDVHSIEEINKRGLNNYDILPKVRLIISSFEQFKKEINEIEYYKNKFSDFKLKLDFKKINENPEVAKKESKKLEQILNEGIEKVKDKEVRELLKESLK